MKKEKYIEAIIEVLKEEGLGLSMETIAQRIGVTKKTLYNRFSSKEAMLDDCLEQISNDFMESLSCMDDESVPIPVRLERGINCLRHYFKKMSHTFERDLQEMYPQKASIDHSNGSTFFENKIAENIVKGKEEGIYRADVDSVLFAKYISYSIFSFFRKKVMMEQDYPAEYYFKQVINFNINALLA